MQLGRAAALLVFLVASLGLTGCGSKGNGVASLVGSGGTGTVVGKVTLPGTVKAEHQLKPSFLASLFHIAPVLAADITQSDVTTLTIQSGTTTTRPRPSGDFTIIVNAGTNVELHVITPSGKEILLAVVPNVGSGQIVTQNIDAESTAIAIIHKNNPARPVQQIIASTAEVDAVEAAVITNLQNGSLEGPLNSIALDPEVLAVVAVWAGPKLAFYSDRDGTVQIYIMNADGSGVARITSPPGNNWDPACSPDGTKIAFQSDRDGNAEIYVMNADGSNQARMTNHPANDTDPHWSPDGTKISWDTDRDGNLECYVMNADGSNPVNMTNNAAYDADAHWSPDGSKFLFQSTRGGNSDLWTMNTDGTNPINLTNHPAYEDHPFFSPDGAKIAFCSTRDQAAREVYVMNADGTNIVRLTNNVAGEFFPTWSRNGSKIAFVSNRDGNEEVYLMNPDGSNQVNLTNNPAYDGKASWSP